MGITELREERVPRGVFVACEFVNETGEAMTLPPSFLFASLLAYVPCFGHKDMEDR